MKVVLLPLLFAQAAASSACLAITVYNGVSYPGCTTADNNGRPWCYQEGGGWRECDSSDDACQFPFTYQGQEYNQCTSIDASAPWCYKVGGGWKYCGSSPAPTPAPGGFGTVSGSAGWVADHNHFRRMHGAGDVTWDADLATKAQTWADNLNKRDDMYHSDSYKTWPASGENLAWGYGSCSAAQDEGGPRLYSGSYDQHCAVASWYGEWYLWKGSGSWQNVAGLGHFTAMVWKGVDAIGCASAGNYYVCEYGSKHCKSHSEYGGSSCSATDPPHLPNFNQDKCSGGACVGALVGASPDLGAARRLRGQVGLWTAGDAGGELRPRASDRGVPSAE